MVFTPESIILSAFSLGVTLTYAIVKVYLNKKLLQTSSLGIVLPSNSGKTTLVNSFKEKFGETTNTILLDIEENVWSSPSITESQKSELDNLLKTDSHLYEAKMMIYTKTVFDELATLLKTSNKSKRIVVLASSKAIITNLGINSYYSFCPSPKLIKLIVDSETASIPFIKFTLDKLNQKGITSIQYSDFDNLFELFIGKLNIKN